MNSAAHKFSIWTASAVVLICTLQLAGCAGRYPPAPAAAGQTDYRYVIGPGDSLQIIVWRNPELSMTVPVRPDGKVTAPLIEDVDVFGKDSTQVARELEKLLAK